MELVCKIANLDQGIKKMKWIIKSFVIIWLLLLEKVDYVIWFFYELWKTIHRGLYQVKYNLIPYIIYKIKRLWKKD